MSKLFIFGRVDPLPPFDDEGALLRWAEKQIRENRIVVVEVDALEPIHAREALGDEEC